MRAYALQGGFGLDRLLLTERDAPRVEAAHVLVRVRAVSLNARDLMMVQGRYNPRQPLPLVPCSDAVGEVVEVGPEVRRVKVGDRVSPLFAQAWMAGEPTREITRSALGGPLDGTLRELMSVHEESLVHVPAHLTDEEAATLPCAGITAWSALVTQGRVKCGDLVCTLGTGGVSIFALQFARLHGARVAITSRSDEKLARAAALGAELGVSYAKDPAWSKPVRAWSGGVGVDHVVEVGGAGTMNESIRSVRPGGTVSLIGVLAGGESQVNLVPVLMQNIRIQGVWVGSRETFEAMNRAVAAAALRPVVDRVFPFEEARAAFEHLERGGHFGKVVIEM